MLRYDKYLPDGLPIATGVIEGACRHLICDRMDITGARWSVRGAEAILRLSSIRSSGDFDEYWRFHLEAEHHRNHASRYAIPPPSPNRERPKLRVLAGGRVVLKEPHPSDIVGSRLLARTRQAGPASGSPSATKVTISSTVMSTTSATPALLAVGASAMTTGR